MSELYILIDIPYLHARQFHGTDKGIRAQGNESIFLRPTAAMIASGLKPKFAASPLIAECYLSPLSLWPLLSFFGSCALCTHLLLSFP